MEWLASSKRPICRARAPVKAPFSRPNSSLSTSVVGNRGAVDPHHRPPAARAQVVDPRREQLLAGAGLAEQQHGRIGGRDLLDQLEGLANRRALADDVAEAGAVADFGSQVDVLRVQLVAQPDHFGMGGAQRLVALAAGQHVAEGGGEHAEHVQFVRRPGALPSKRVEAHGADDPAGDGQRHGDRRADAEAAIALAVDRHWESRRPC